MQFTLSICKRLLAVLLLLVAGMQTQAQVQATVTVNRLFNGRYPTKLYQFQQYPNVITITLTNTTTTTQRIYINGTMTGDNGVQIRTKPNYTPGAIDLAPLQQKRLNASEAAQLFDQSAIEVVQGGQDVKNNIIRDQALPEGMYQICVRAFDYATRQPVSPEEPLGCSNTFTIAMLEAPVILSPMDRDSVKAFAPQNMIFRWSVPPGAPPSTQYTLKIVEAFKAYDAAQGSYFQANANEIIQTTPTPVFETMLTGAGSFLYGPGQPPLIKGRTYAFVVTAKDPQLQAQFRNGGQSMAILFKYGITSWDDQKDFIAINKDTLPKQPTTITGKLQYRFAGDGEGALYPLAHEPVYLKKVWLRKTYTADSIASYRPLTAKEQLQLPEVSDPFDGQMARTDEAGNFSLTVGMTSLDSAGVVSNDTWNTLFGASSPIQKQRYAPGASLRGTLACRYEVVTVNPHFKPSADATVDLVPGGSQQLPGLVLDARSYALLVNVAESFNGQKGAFVPGAKIRIYRLTTNKKDSALHIPFYEGAIRNTTLQQVQDKVLIAEGTTPKPAASGNGQDYYVTFNRLFKNLPGEEYNYIVSLEKGQQVLSSQTYSSLQAMSKRVHAGGKATTDTAGWKEAWQSWSYNKGSDTAYLTLEKQVTAAPRSRVKGRLTYRYKDSPGVPSQPYANMRVSLQVAYLREGKPVRPVKTTTVETHLRADLDDVLATVTTDADGRFEFDFENTDSTLTTVTDTLRTVKDASMPGSMWQYQFTTYQDTRVYRIVPQVKYYCAPDKDITVQPWTDFDCGELFSYVNIYDLKVHVSGENASRNNNTVNLDPLREAQVMVMRKLNDPFLPGLPELPGQDENTAISYPESAYAAGTTTGTGSMQVTSYPWLPGSSQYQLKRRYFVDNDSGIVVIKNLTGSTDMNNDVYWIGIGSNKRDKGVSYTSRLFSYPNPDPLLYRGDDAAAQIWTGEVDPWAANAAQWRNYAEALEQYTKTEKQTVQPGDDRMTGGGLGRDPGGMVIPMGNTTFTNLLNSLGNSGPGLAAPVGPAGVKRPQQIRGGPVVTGMNEEETEPGETHAPWMAPRPPASFVVPMEDYSPYITPGQVVYNSEYSLKQYDLYALLNRAEPRIAGRVLNAVTTLPVKATVRYSQGTLHTFSTCDANGDFVIDLKNMKTGKQGSLFVYADGYESFNLDPLGSLDKGVQYYNPQMLLKPLGLNRFGLVADRDDTTKAVTARIKMLLNGKWVNTTNEVLRSVKLPNGTTRFAKANFSIDLPASASQTGGLPVKIVVMPYDRAYMTDTVELIVKQEQPYLGTIRLTKRKHRVQVYVGNNGFSPPAQVTLEETGETKAVTGLRSFAYFEFENNASSNFTLRVKQQIEGNTVLENIFVPVSTTFESKDDGSITTVTVAVEKGQVIRGKVNFENGSPVQGAKIFPESGSGSGTDNFTLSGAEGNYLLVTPRLAAVPQLTVKASFNQAGKTFVSAEKQVSSGALLQDNVNLVIKEIGDIDLSKLYGFPVRVNNISKNNDNTYTVSGELYHLPANDNFSVKETGVAGMERTLQFYDLVVKPAALKNAQGIPYGVPVSDAITTANRELALRINQAFTGVLHSEDAAQQLPVQVRRLQNDTSGQVSGQVRIIANSFYFPSSYMRLDSTDFYISNTTPQGTGGRGLPVFTAGAQHPVASRFSLTTRSGTAIRFRYLGFAGEAETAGQRSSYLQKDTVHLFMNLSATIPGNIPVTFKAGEAVVWAGGIGRIVTTGAIGFNLEQWKVAGEEWTLAPNTGGLVIRKGQLVTGKVNLPFTDMTIIPNEEGVPGDLDCQSLEDPNQLAANLTIGNLVKLKLNPANKDKPAFVFDPGVGRDGRGHYKLAIRSVDSYAASFTGLDGVTAGDFKVQIISLLSNGEELFGFQPNAAPVTFYNQLAFQPMALYANENSIAINGNMNLGIPYLDKQFYVPLSFYKEGNKNKLVMDPFKFSFMGPGNVRFTATGTKETQRFKNEGYAISGDMEPMENGQPVYMLHGANLVSMAVEGAKPLVMDALNNGAGQVLNTLEQSAAGQEVKRQVDILLGTKEQIEDFTEKAVEEAKNAVKQAKDQLMDEMNSVVGDYTKQLPLSELGKIGKLAGQWRLAGDGMKAIANGDYLRLTGMMEMAADAGIPVGDITNQLKLHANNAVKAVQDAIPIDPNVPIKGDGFKNAGFDMKGGRVFGKFSFKTLMLGAVTLKNGDVEMMFDKGGWYFYTGAEVVIPSASPIFPIAGGLLIGKYGTISPELEATATRTAYVKKLPSNIKNGLAGFFITGRKDIIPEFSVGLDVGLVSGKFAANLGLDARVYARFGRTDQYIGFGAMAFGNVSAKLAAFGNAIGIEGGVSAEVAIKGAFANRPSGLEVTIDGCTSLKLYYKAWWPIGGTASGDASLVMLLGYKTPSNLHYSIDFGAQPCSQNADFDY
jgi:hypothetical protein